MPTIPSQTTLTAGLATKPNIGANTPQAVTSTSTTSLAETTAPTLRISGGTAIASFGTGPSSGFRRTLVFETQTSIADIFTGCPSGGVVMPVGSVLELEYVNGTWRALSMTHTSASATPDNSGVGFVRSLGGFANATGKIGFPEFPFATVQAAFNAGARIFDLGVGTYVLTVAVNTDYTFFVHGVGRSSILEIITEDPANGASTTGHWYVHSDFSAIIELSNNGATGTSGADAALGSDADGDMGGTGGDGGNINAYNCLIDLVQSTGIGGPGGAGDGVGASGPRGEGGAAGSVLLFNCITREIGSPLTAIGGSVMKDSSEASLGFGTLYFDEAGANNSAPTSPTGRLVVDGALLTALP